MAAALILLLKGAIGFLLGYYVAGRFRASSEADRRWKAKLRPQLPTSKTEDRRGGDR